MNNVGPTVKKMRTLSPGNPMDSVVDDMAIASKDRIRKEVDDRKIVPNTLSEEIKKALG